jgi:hypothetical protein
MESASSVSIAMTDGHRSIR